MKETAMKKIEPPEIDVTEIIFIYIIRAGLLLMGIYLVQKVVMLFGGGR